MTAWWLSSSGDSEMIVAGRLKRLSAVAQRLGAKRSLAVGQVLRLVPVRVGDVGEVDVEGGAGLDDAVRGLEHAGERVRRS